MPTITAGLRLPLSWVLPALLVSACNFDPSAVDEPGLDLDRSGGPRESATVQGVRYSAFSLPAEPTPWGVATFEVRFVAENLNEESVAVELDLRQPGCHYRYRAYSSQQMDGSPAFDSGVLTTDHGYGCRMFLQVLELAPGEKREYSTGRLAHPEVLGDSLPAGLYYGSLAIKPVGLPAIELAAGSVELHR